MRCAKLRRISLSKAACMKAFLVLRSGSSTSSVLRYISIKRHFEVLSDLPFGPLPSEAEIAQMMSKPIQEAYRQLQIHSFNVFVQISNSSTQTWSDCCWGYLAGFCQNRVVVHQ